MKTFRPREDGDRRDGDGGGGRNTSVDFRGEKRSNDTHASTTDPDAMLYGLRFRMCAPPCIFSSSIMGMHSLV